MGANQVEMRELISAPLAVTVFGRGWWMARALAFSCALDRREGLCWMAAAVPHVDISSHGRLSSSHECEDITFHLLWPSPRFKIVQMFRITQ